MPRFLPFRSLSHALALTVFLGTFSATLSLGSQPAQADSGDGGLIYWSSGARFLDVAPLAQSVAEGQSLPGTPGGVFWDNGLGVMATVNQFILESGREWARMGGSYLMIVMPNSADESV